MSLGDRFNHTQAVPAVLGSVITPAEVRVRARRRVEARALNDEDCRVLLDMLGLTPRPVDCETTVLPPSVHGDARTEPV